MASGDKLYVVYHDNKVRALYTDKGLIQQPAVDEALYFSDTPLPCHVVKNGSYCNKDSTHIVISRSLLSTAPQTIYLWIPLILQGCVDDNENIFEELRLGFDASGPYYYCSYNEQLIRFNISLSVVESNELLTITGDALDSAVSINSISRLSAMQWVPFYRPSAISPTKLLISNNDHKLMSYGQSATPSFLLAKRRGYEQVGENVSAPGWSMPLAIYRGQSVSSLPVYDFFDFVNYRPGQDHEPTQFGGCYTDPGFGETNASLSSLVLTDLLSAWITPTSYWHADRSTGVWDSGFNASEKAAITTIVQNQEKLLTDNNSDATRGQVFTKQIESNLNILNLLSCYTTILAAGTKETQFIGYDPRYGFWRNSDDVLAENSINGVRFNSTYTPTYALTITSPEQVSYHTKNKITFSNETDNNFNIQSSSDEFTLRAGSLMTRNITNTTTYSFVADVYDNTPQSITIDPSKDIGRTVIITDGYHTQQEANGTVPAFTSGTPFTATVKTQSASSDQWSIVTSATVTNTAYSPDYKTVTYTLKNQGGGPVSYTIYFAHKYVFMNKTY